MTHLTTTTEMLAVLRRGHDEPIWALFVERYRPVLVAVAERMGVGRDDAQDAAQQALMEFVRDFGRGRYDRSRSRLRAWLIGILRHRVADLLRLRGRTLVPAASRTHDPVEASIVELADPAAEDSLERVWEAEVERRLIQSALERLRMDSLVEARTLQAFELTVLRDVPVEAAAAACGMSVNGVYVARSRVAARLRRLLDVLAPAYQEDAPRSG